MAIATIPNLENEIKAGYPDKFEPLFWPKRYKVFYGGRGSGKSTTFARLLLGRAYGTKMRIACFRELQTSIKDSVHLLLRDQIDALGLNDAFEVTQASIRSLATGSEFLFKGLRSNISEIKSMEGIDIAWVEEAQLVSKDSWEILIPTIRKEGSEIWVSFNPIEDTDPTYQRFIVNPPPDSYVIKVGWQDNDFFPKTLNEERLYMLRTDPEAYEHVWEGSCRVMSEAVIFRGHYIIDSFEMPAYPNEVRLFHGADWGFANDPTVLVRCWTTGEAPNEELWIDQEAYAVGCEIDKTPALFDQIPTAREWPIKGDCARPETISYVRRQGFNVEAAEKWPGCVADRIAHLKGFKQIHIHQRCKELQTEARLYSYKRDRVTGEVLPMIVDKHNHCWDAVGYALDQYIPHRGGLGVWLKL
jgi:phage terminase large subunit